MFKKVIKFMMSIIFKILLIGCSLSAPNLDQITEYFHSNREELQIVVDYFISTGFHNIRIWRNDVRDDDPTNIELSINLGRESIVISNEDVGEAVLFLFQQESYRGVTKVENFIIFQRWSTLDSGSGMVYSIDRSVPNENIFPYLVELESLPVAGWYFYVDDVNEWRRQQNLD